MPSEWRTARVRAAAGFAQLSYGVLGDYGVVEGDIVFPLADLAAIEEAPSADGCAPAAVTFGLSTRWPNGVVTYRIDPGLPNPQRR